MSPDLEWQDALKPHPEWFEKNERGEFARHTEDARLYRTCMFSTYFTEHIPAIMREVNSRYDVDGIFTNGWPPLGRLPDDGRVFNDVGWKRDTDAAARS